MQLNGQGRQVSVYALRAVRDQVLRVSDHDGCRSGVHALAALRLQLADERLVNVRGSGALAPGSRGGRGVQIGEQRVRLSIVLDRTAAKELRDIVLDAVGGDYHGKRLRFRAGIVHFVHGIHRERVRAQ